MPTAPLSTTRPWKRWETAWWSLTALLPGVLPAKKLLASDYPGIVFIKVNLDKAPSLGKELSVWAMPTFVFFKHGKRVGSFMGANQNLLRRGLENDGQVSMCSQLSCQIQ